MSKTYKFVLRPTKTFQCPGCRSGRFLRFTKFGFPPCGVLTVEERTNRKSGPRVRRWVVSMAAEGGGFTFSKSALPRDFYVAAIDGKSGWCTCKSWTLRGYCVHVECLQALAGCGAVPNAPGEAPRKPYKPRTGGREG